MRLLLFWLLSWAGLANCLAHWTCAECEAVVGGLAAMLTSPAGLTDQVQLLVTLLCPGTARPPDCQQNLPELWPSLATALWPAYYNPAASWMCDELCESAGRAVTCAECEHSVTATVQQLLQPEFIAGVTEFLAGEQFCGQQETPDQVPRLID